MVTNNANRDFVAILFIAIITFILASTFDILEKIVNLSARYEHFEIDEIVKTFIVLVFCMGFFSYRRWGEIVKSRDIIIQKNKEMQIAIAEINRLKGTMPLCRFCKKIRNDSGGWVPLDIYLNEHSDANVSHDVCPLCTKENHHNKE